MGFLNNFALKLSILKFIKIDFTLFWSGSNFLQVGNTGISSFIFLTILNAWCCVYLWECGWFLATLNTHFQVFSWEMGFCDIYHIITTLCWHTTNLPWKFVPTAQCENLKIFIILRFYVKSILLNLHVKSAILRIFGSEIFDFGEIVPHIVEIQDFICNKDFSWNQFWWILKATNAILTISVALNGMICNIFHSF